MKRSKGMREIAVMILGCMLAGCATVAAPKATDTDDVFLDKVERAAFRYFEECSNPEKGLVQDRAPNFEKPSKEKGEQYQVASVAATGYYLSAYVVAAERGWVSKAQAEERVLKALRFFATGMEQEHGFYYHFVDMKTGKRVWGSELSSIDTALFLAGVIHAKEYFTDNAEIQELAKTLYERVDWQWMTNGTKFLCMGWKPTRNGGRFLKEYWDHFSEALVMYIMAIGSPTHPLPASTWHALSKKIKRYGDYVCVAYSALFTHQYPHIWIDFRDKNDGSVDYFQNSVIATLANRQYCLDNRGQYKTYEENVWGLTACDGPGGYKAYGGKPGYENHDGTIAPTAAGGSLPFTPQLSTKALRAMYEKYGDRLWGRYGFSDSFNIDRNWFAKDCIAIDQGTILLMAENMRNENVWRYTMKNPWIQAGMKRIGFVPGTKEVQMPKPPHLVAYKTQRTIQIDGKLDDWDLSKGYSIDEMYLEYGSVDDMTDYSGKMYFAWDDTYFYFALKVKDDDIEGRKGGSFIYKDDCVEMYFDPQSDGLLWNDAHDVQLGLSLDARSTDGRVKSWAWFQNKNTEKTGDVTAVWVKNSYGYILEAAIKWDALLVKPQTPFRFSISLHDKDKKDEAKLTTYFEDYPSNDGRKELGTLSFE